MALLTLFFIEIPGNGKKNTTNVDENCQKLKSLSQHNSGENKYPKNPEDKPTTSHVVGLRDNVTNPNLPDDDQNAAGFSSTKGSFTTPSTPRTPSLPRTVDSIVPVSSSTVQSLKSHNCCCKYSLILLFIYLIFLIYSHYVETGFGKKLSIRLWYQTFLYFSTAACHSILNSISRKLDALLNIHADNPQPTTTHQANVLPNFPISSHEDLKKFNQSLIDKEAARTQYVIPFFIYPKIAQNFMFVFVVNCFPIFTKNTYL